MKCWYQSCENEVEPTSHFFCPAHEAEFQAVRTQEQSLHMHWLVRHVHVPPEISQDRTAFFSSRQALTQRDTPTG